MQIGVVLPSFSRTAESPLDAARRCEDSGVDGVFCFDHLWPMGHPGRPALSLLPLLGALIATTSSIRVGSLVARIGLMPDDVLISALLSVQRLGDRRLIAGLGTGDSKSSRENLAFGLEYSSASVRRTSVEYVARVLGEHEVDTWIGAGHNETNAIALRLGTTLNLWGVEPAVVERQAQKGPVSWAGNLPKGEDEAISLLNMLHEGRASWAVFNWPGSLEPLMAALQRSAVRE